MRRWRVVLFVIVALVGPAALLPAARADVQADYKAASAAYDSGKYVEAERITTQILASGQLSPSGRVTVLFLRGIARYGSNKYAPAVDDFNKAFATAAKADKALIRYDRLLALTALERFDEAYKDALALAQNYPSAIKDLPMRTVFRIGGHLLQKDRHDDLLTLLVALKKAEYRGPDPLQSTDYLYIYLIRELASHNRADEAAPIVADLTHYSTLLEVRIGRNYETLWAKPSLAPLLQPRDFPGRELTAAQKLLAQHPRSLQALVGLVSALRLSGRYADAVKMAQDTLKTPTDFDKDANDELWLKNELAYALQAQGRFADADAVLQPLLKLSAKDNSSLVNQLINFGEMLLGQGRYQEAIDTSQKAHGFSSPFGEKYVQKTNACALFRLGKINEAEAILLEMMKKPEENYEAVTTALLCLKHEDLAAAIVIKRLLDKTYQYDMLTQLQACRDNPKAPPLNRELHAALMRVRERPDVKIALAPVGVVITEPIACGDN